MRKRSTTRRRVPHDSRGLVLGRVTHTTQDSRRSPRLAPVTRRLTASRVTLVVLALGVAGCERGCLSTWLAEHGAGSGGRGDPSGPGPRSPGLGGAGPRGSDGRDGSAIDLGGTDCSDGLARCSQGQVQVSIAAHVPHPCVAAKETPGACACPWQTVGQCRGACVKDGIEVVAVPDVAREQLCDPGGVGFRPPIPSESAVVTICGDDGVSCVDGVVRACASRGQPSRVAGVCVNGCAPGVVVDPGDVLTGDGAAMILCRRAHAERQ